jgi:peptidyl-prolyl cis-trans isomerase B (cyclophilin B)
VILATLVAAAAFGGPQDDPAPRTVEPPKTLQVALEAPGYFVGGKPFAVTVTVTAPPAGATVPVWALGSGAFQTGQAPLGGRPEGELALVGGQVLTTTLDLAPLIDPKAGGSDGFFELTYAVGPGASTHVVALTPANEAIDFMAIDAAQLAKYQVLMRTSQGDLWLDFWPDVAPNHVRNFLDLSHTGFYDDSCFHRVIDGFMVQGGQHAEGEKAPRQLDAEFNKQRHVKGVLSAARLGHDINSASSEFFIMHAANAGLDGQYTAYGMLLDGFPVVDRIAHSRDKRFDKRTEAGWTPVERQTIEWAVVVHAVRGASTQDKATDEKANDRKD